MKKLVAQAMEIVAQVVLKTPMENA